VFIGSSVLLRLLPEFDVTGHAAHLARYTFAVRRLDDVLVTPNAILFAVHTAAEGSSGDMQVPRIAKSVIPGKSVFAMTTKATVITKLGIGGFCFN
jgi:hypothetical protein